MKIEDQEYKYWVVATTVSTTIAFAQFCIIVVFSIVKIYRNNFKCACRIHQARTEDRFGDELVHENGADEIFNFQTAYLRESILEY